MTPGGEDLQSATLPQRRTSQGSPNNQEFEQARTAVPTKDRPVQECGLLFGRGSFAECTRLFIAARLPGTEQAKNDLGWRLVKGIWAAHGTVAGVGERVDTTTWTDFGHPASGEKKGAQRRREPGRTPH